MSKKTPTSKSKAKGSAPKASPADKKKVVAAKPIKPVATKPTAVKPVTAKPVTKTTSAKAAPAKAVASKAPVAKAPEVAKGKVPAPVVAKAKGAKDTSAAKPGQAKPAAGKAKPDAAKGTNAKVVKPDHEAQKKLLDSHRKTAHTEEEVMVVPPRPKLQFYTIADIKNYLATRKKSGSKLNLWVPEEERKAREKAAAASRSQGTRTHNIAAASIDDLLGGSSAKGSTDSVDESKQIPEKFRRYYRLLVDMREALQKGVAFHSEEALKKNGKDDAGDLSGYSQHLADAGTDTADRDFALSLISNEQEALKDIADAIESMKRGTYGVCEITQKAIPHARLMAVPFTRYSLEGQKELERNRRAHRRRGNGNPLGEISDEVGFGTGGGGGEDEPSDS
jgi:RNA polymerase-binding transcription factor DksA